MQDWKRPSTHGLRSVRDPRYMDQERAVESVWATERARRSRTGTQHRSARSRPRRCLGDRRADTGCVLHEFTDGRARQPRATAAADRGYLGAPRA